jgi:hypothetical protein
VERQSIRPRETWTYDTSMSKPERQKYKIAGPATWELIRAAYLAGESAPALAERFGVSAHAIRKRISVEGWTKRAYAEALEARGLAPPEKPKTVNFAERFAASYVPPPAPVAPSEDAHPFMDLVAALKEASAAAERGQANETEGAATEQTPAETAAALERRALAQASAAVSKGRASDAKSFAAFADQMRKRVDEDRAAVAAEAHKEHKVFKEREAELVGKFRYAAFLASCMVHNPEGAPAIFVDCIAAVRRDAFGEGDEESLAAARASAEESRRYFGLDEERWQAAFAATAREPGSDDEPG